MNEFFLLPWWAHLGSNQGPTGYEPVALPAELWAHSYYMLSPKGVNPSQFRNSDCGFGNGTPHSAIGNPHLTLGLEEAFQFPSPAGMP